MNSAPSQRAMPACLQQECDLESGPVCGIDASGMPLTFENRCMAMLAYCRFGSCKYTILNQFNSKNNNFFTVLDFAEVKPGEC